MAVKKSTGRAPNFKDRTGIQYDRLTVIRFDGYKAKPGRKKKCSYWICQCICGTTVSVNGDHLERTKDGRGTGSCGCLLKDETVKHGMYASPVYAIWQAMIQRCINPNNPGYGRYGGRGITVCERWLNSFENFYADMGDPPDGYSIERKRNSEGYYPENCAWETIDKQNRNKRSNHRITIGDETKCLCDWVKHFGISVSTFYERVRGGMTEQEALTKPKQPRYYR